MSGPESPERPVLSDAAWTVESAGHFRIYLGAAPGVGKTFAMLNEGRRRAERGTDVVVAVAEGHGRPRTIDLLAGLETVPRRAVEYRGRTFEEMDLAAVLARRPRVALVDELAHTNIPGSGPHEKRWQDVADILDASIDVITTVNIQHLESIADAVETMTGSRVRERVPDWVVRRADQIELVDSSPEQLRRRMLHGNVYPPEKVPQALEHFFRSENLIALRELALRFLADETDEDLIETLRRHPSATRWETAERIAVAVTAAPGTDGLLRRAARMAARAKAELTVVHVTDDDDAGDLGELRTLADDLGARWQDLVADDPARALVGYARDAQVTQLVIGATMRSRLRERLEGGGLIARVIRQATEAGIDVHVIARRAPGHGA
jgi:two-component system sensor histidine kinase KdpD